MNDIYKINISDDLFNQIITCIGYPLITVNDQESDIEMDKNSLIEYCVGPALVEYYKWFPIIETNTSIPTWFLPPPGIIISAYRFDGSINCR